MVVFDIIPHYQFGFFTPDSAVDPTPEIISDFLQAFKGTSFIPTTVPIHKVGSSETRQLLTLVTKEKNWQIEFNPDRISFTRQRTPDGKICTPEVFINETIEYCSKVLSVLDVKGTRLTFITKGILEQMDSDALKTIYGKLFKALPFYSDNSPTEWSSRNVSQYNSTGMSNPQETLNVISSINQVIVSQNEAVEAQEDHRIEISFDINTHHMNKSERFSVEHVNLFLNEVSELRERLLKEIKDSLL